MTYDNSKNNWDKQLNLVAEEAGELFKEFVKVVGALRNPKTGCPWDLKQNHLTLRKYMLEEAYEAVEAMGRNHSQDMQDEFGDVLLQVVLNAQVAMDDKNSDIRKVIATITEKMKRRHPHVFGGGELATAEQVSEQWQKIKAEEKKGTDGGNGVFEDVRDTHPSTAQAYAIGKVAKQIDFDWPNVDAVFDQFQSEIGELKAELRSQSPDRLELELGDVYFSLAQLCRHLKIDPEIASNSGNIKFLNRFKSVEALSKAKGLDIRAASRKLKESLWQEAKRLENKD